MWTLLLDAGLLLFLIKLVTDEDVSLWAAGGTAFVSSIAMFGLALGLAALLGPWLGLLLAGVIVALGVGLVVAVVWGVDLKRSFGVGAGFVVAHILLSLILSAISRT